MRGALAASLFAACALASVTLASVPPVLVTEPVTDSARQAAEPDLAQLFEQMRRDYLHGQYETTSSREQRADFDRVLALSQQVHDVVARRCGLAPDVPEQEAVRRLRADPDGARAELWGAVAWGLYGMSHSMLASATHGVADKIRVHAERLIAIDPDSEDGAGYRLLGRLHTTVPAVPFVSAWIDHATGVDLLRKALATSQIDPRNFFFLAEALLDGPRGGVPTVRDEAVTLLRRAATFEPRADHPQEDRETIGMARGRLTELGIDLENEP